MSYHSKQQMNPLRHRSLSSVRNVGGNSYNSRPRSTGYFSSASTSAYSSPYSTSNNPYSSSIYSTNYNSPYLKKSYRTPNNSGYASITIPSKSLKNYDKITANNYSNINRDYRNDSLLSTNGHRSRRDLTRNGSFNRERDRSLSRSHNSLINNGMGSKSISLTSLISEGYVSGSERSSRSRLGSTSDIRNENGEIDYKKLYEQAIVENDLLKEKLKKSDEELRETKQTLERINVVTSKNSLSELEKRERRAMERKLSEMEEELKQLQKLKAENERLKADNRSLTRVITKLTNSPKK